MGQVTIPTRLNFQTSAQDLEYRTALNRIVYPQRVPRPFFYPMSPYAGGTGTGIKGLGNVQLDDRGCVPYDYYGFLEAFRAEGLITDCGLYQDPAAQYACVQQNQPTLNLIQSWAGTCISPSQVPSNYVPTPGSAGDPNANPNTTGILILPNQLPVQTIPNPGTPTGTPTAPVGSPPTFPTAPTSYSPRVSFSTARQGTLYPGDSWQIQITGGAPNTPVYADGTFNGSTNRNTMGSTDAAGNFSLTGSIGASEVGNWSETWWVGQNNAGTFSFSVSPTPSTGAPAGGTSAPWNPPAGSGLPYTTPTPTGGTAPTGGYTPAPTGGTPAGTTPPVSTSGDLINGIPNNYLMIGAAGILALALLGGRR